MIRYFFSRYHPRYVRSLVYMLQASEYHIRDYCSWLRRVKNFSRVESRKKLLLTPKAIIFLVIGYALYLGVWSGLVYFALSSPQNYVILILWLLAFPELLAYGFIIPVFAFTFLAQKPAEYFIVRKAQRILAKHAGIKIAVAGSYGKTTMREILKTVLSQGKKTAAPPQSHNTPLGIAQFAQSLSGDEEVLIFELGEYYPGDVARLCKFIRPEIGVITGVNEAHLEKFKTLEKTADTVWELAAYVESDKLYMNGENENVRKRVHPGNVLYSQQGIGSWRVIQKETGLGGTRFRIQKGERTLELQSHLLGLHQIGPLLATLAIAFRLGLSEGQVKEGIQATRPFDHRLEVKKGPNNATILDDSYNGNPDGVKAVIEFLSSIRDRRRWYVTPGLVEMGDKTELVHQDIGRQLAQAGIENIALMRNSVTPFIEEGLRGHGYTKDIIWFETMPKFLENLPHLTLEHDVILIQNDWPDQYV